MTLSDAGSPSLLRDNNDACLVARMGDNTYKAPVACLVYYRNVRSDSFNVIILTIIPILSVHMSRRNLL